MCCWYCCLFSWEECDSFAIISYEGHYLNYLLKFSTVVPVTNSLATFRLIIAKVVSITVALTVILRTTSAISCSSVAN